MELSVSQRLFVYTNMRDLLKRKLDIGVYSFGFCKIFNLHLKVKEGVAEWSKLPELSPLYMRSAADWFDALTELRDIGFRVTGEEDSFGLVTAAWASFTYYGCLNRIEILDEAISEAYKSIEPKEDKINVLFENQTSIYLSVTDNKGDFKTEFMVPRRTDDSVIKQIAALLGYNVTKFKRP